VLPSIVYGKATWQVPIGKGRKLGNNLSKAADYAIGGWELSGIYSYAAGVPLIFSTSIVAPASVKQLSQQGSTRLWFDTTGFAAAPSFTRRTNPWYYDGLKGPNFRNMDFSLAKRIAVTERIGVQLRIEAFNALNGMNGPGPAMPGMTP